MLFHEAEIVIAGRKASTANHHSWKSDDGSPTLALTVKKEADFRVIDFLSDTRYLHFAIQKVGVTSVTDDGDPTLRVCVCVCVRDLVAFMVCAITSPNPFWPTVCLPLSHPGANWKKLACRQFFT